MGLLEPRLESYGSKGVSVEDEQDAIRAGVLYFLTVRSDVVAIRERITFVIDVSANKKNVGNEKKLQMVWLEFPLRPQRILIMGAGAIKRIFIKVVIKFSEAKIVDRIQFVDKAVMVKELGNLVSEYVESTGFTSEVAMAQWVKDRIAELSES